jgi:ornithine carbamoyltransferase
MVNLRGRDFLSISEVDKSEFDFILETAKSLKERYKVGDKPKLLDGKTVAMIFKKHSTRTRLSFQAGLAHLGAQAFYMRPDEMQLARGETTEDTARIIDGYCDGLVIRTYEQEEVETYAKYMKNPVINALTDLEHPCQIVADFLTILEKKKRLEGLRMVYAGDVWNVCHSLMLGCPKMGMDLYVARPEGYNPNPKILQLAEECAKDSGTRLEIGSRLKEAVRDADIVYGNTWHSMGKPEADKAKRLADFSPFRIDSSVMKAAKRDAIFMHCLPAYRGEEVTAEVIDGPQSVVFDEGENRMHAQKAILALLL